MKIVLTDAQTVFDEIVDSSPLNELGEVKSYGLLKYGEVAEAVRDGLQQHRHRLLPKKGYRRLQRRLVLDERRCPAHLRADFGALQQYFKLQKICG